ncbi:MAG: hypothetical protein HGA93_05620 [Methanothrix sp.]|nr:hypothetical protein [Methanothrix sp.]
MKFDRLCFCLLALLLGTGAAAGQGMSLFESMDMTGGAFSEDFVNGLFGIGTGASSAASGPWFGPEFENSSSAGSFFSEFYINTSIPVISGFTPVKFDVTHRMPSRIYFGSGQEVLYTQYQSAMAASRGNELWIQKGADWSQYAIVPAGTGMQFIAFTPAGGQADYYELLQTNSLNATGKRLDFYSGYNSLNFMADKVGRHVLFFVLNNQPSNSIIIDVIAQAPPAQQTAAASGMPPSTNQPAGYVVPGAASQTTYATQYSSAGVSSQYQSAASSTQTQAFGSTSAFPPQTSQTGIAAGDTPVTIQTTMRGYDVYLDGAMIGKDGANGDALDGVFRFNVVGGQTHTIRIFDGQNNYEKPMYFERGVAKVIHVPPAATVYVPGGSY